MKTIRNQVKYPIGLRLPLLLEKGIKTCPYSVFYAAKNNNKKTTNKNQLKLARKRCRSRKAIFLPSKYVQLCLRQTLTL